MRLRQPVGRHLAMKTGRQQTAGGTVFQPVQHLAHDAKARRHQPAGIARMNAFGQHLDFERARHHAAQAGGQPELVVVAGARVQADHQAHIAQPAAQCIHIRQQVVRAAFFAGLDQPDNARVRHLLAFQRLNGGDAGVGCVAVVSAAAAVELAVLVAGRPRAQVGAPAAELGLLVQMAIHQHRLRCLARHGRTGGRHFKKQHRRAAGQTHHFQGQAFDFLRFDPAGGVAHHRVDKAMLRPVTVKARRLGRNGDVLADLAHDVAVPLGADLVQRNAGVQNRRWQTCSHKKLLTKTKQMLSL